MAYLMSYYIHITVSQRQITLLIAHKMRGVRCSSEDIPNYIHFRWLGISEE